MAKAKAINSDKRRGSYHDVVEIESFLHRPNKFQLQSKYCVKKNTISILYWHMIYTLLFYQIEPQKNGPSLILLSSIARKSSAPEAKRIFEIL